MSPRVSPYYGPWWADNEATASVWLALILFGAITGRILAWVL